MTGPIVECVPNFSEGVDRQRVEAIVAAMRGDGVHLLDWSMDADHNRSVITIAGTPSAVVEAAVRGAACVGCTHQHYLTAPKAAAKKVDAVTPVATGELAPSVHAVVV